MDIDGANLNIKHDGHFEINFLEDGVFLTVFPPINGGKKIEMNDVIEKFNKKRMRNFNKAEVEIAVTKATGQPCEIAEPQEEIKVDVGIVVNISNDKMKSFIKLTPSEGGRMLTYTEVMEEINKGNVVFGINENNVKDLVRSPVFNQFITVAEGIQEVNGQNGSINYLVDIAKVNKQTLLKDGSVDYKELGIIKSVMKGQVLCSLTPATLGTSGKNVCGIELKALDGKAAILPKGKNVESLEDGISLIASIDGQVDFSEGKLSIFASHEVNDVDFSTGNIKFIGNVHVKGNVLSGFIVEAMGNIEVDGVVESATLKAGGDIILKRGMQGGGKGLISAGHDIIAKFIENAIVEAKNDINAEAILHSRIKCGNKLELLGNKGLLIGGVIHVGNEIIAKVIGTLMSTVTEIEVGVDPTLNEEYKQHVIEVTKLQDESHKLEQVIVILKKLQSVGQLFGEKLTMLERSISSQVVIKDRLIELNETVARIEEILSQEINGKIKVQDVIYPGTKITIGNVHKYLKDDIKFCTLTSDGVDIKTLPYE